MKICVLGLDCASPDVLFADQRLVNLRRLMEAGVYGRLETVIPPITVPAWMCMATSQDPGSLGVYGFRNRGSYSYEPLKFVNSGSIRELAIWDLLALQGKRSILVGVPPGYPPRRINGISIGCLLTPDPVHGVFTHPPGIQAKITELVGEYPVDIEGFRTHDKERLRREIFEMSRKQWTVVHWLLREQEWDYFQFVDIGLDRMYHGFWGHLDPADPRYRAGNPYQGVIPDYHRWLDEQIGCVLDLLDQETILLVVSDHGAQRLEGCFAINEWLVREGLLRLEECPKQITPFNKLRIDYARTRVWSEGGHYGRIFLNVQGREPQGVVPAAEYEAFRDEMKARLEALTDPQGCPLNSLVFKPNEIYRNVRNIPPDLIVYLGGLSWRPIGSVGHGGLHVLENDSGPDASSHSRFGMFVLAAPNCPLNGEYTGARLLDIAPTLLRLGGYEVPASMQGRSLVDSNPSGGSGVQGGDEEGAIFDRLAGLGYV